MQYPFYSSRSFCLFLIGSLLPRLIAAQAPVIDGVKDASAWGAPVLVADGTPGWEGANAKNIYIREDGCYLYLAADVTAQQWMAWAFILDTKPGGGTTDTWARAIDYNHPDAPDVIIRGHFDNYAQLHTWNGTDWDGIGAGLASSEFGESITNSNQDGWLEVRIEKTRFDSLGNFNVQLYITGDKDEHGSFDAVPNDDNAISWNENSNRTPLDQYGAAFANGGGAVVIVDPPTPGPDDSVTVTFNAACTPLENASKVYFHSGVSTDPTAPTNFSIAVGNWGQDDGVGEMDSIAPNVWRIGLASLREYYQVDSTLDVFGFNFLFRSADGSIKEDAGGANYHRPVNPGPYFTIQEPAFSPFFSPVNAPVAILTPGSGQADWLLRRVDTTGAILDTLFAVMDTVALDRTVSVPDTGIYRYKITADFGGGVVKHKFFEIKGYSEVEIASVPPGMRLGINYHENDDTKATLVLHTPTSTTFYDGNDNVTGTNATTPKKVVYVIGDFNDWQPLEAYKMKREPGDRWWITLSDLEPGKEYVFQYLIDGNLQVGDPYAEKVSDFDDKYIPDSVYPNLIQYPDAAFDRATVLQTAQPEFQWTAPDFPRPLDNELNIYELHFRDFTDEGTYAAATEKLDYIKSLGINAIHVMPVSEFEGNTSWGYNPNFYFAPDKAYGAKDDLKRFIDECHKREIQVFNDIVLNHAYYSNVMARMYWNQALNRPADDNPWFNPTHKMVRSQDGHWGADWNHASEHTRAMVDSILNFWLQEYRFDGFRFDFTKGFGQTDPNAFPFGDDWASTYNQDRIDLLKRMVNRMWAANPGSVVIFEHLANADEDKVLADHGILLWSGQGHHGQVKNFILGWPNDNTDIYNSGIYSAPGRNFTFANWMSYEESHDEERLAYELLLYGKNISTETDSLLRIEKMIDRLKIGRSFNQLFPGPRMVWQFGELGYDVSIGFNGRTGEKPVRWEYYDDPLRKELYRLLSRIFFIRNQYNIYHNLHTKLNPLDPNHGNYNLGGMNMTTPRRMELHDDGGRQVIVIANLDPDNAHGVQPGYDFPGRWYKYNGDPTVDGDTFQVTDLNSWYQLQPSEMVLLTNFRVGQNVAYCPVADTLAGAPATGVLYPDTNLAQQGLVSDAKLEAGTSTTFSAGEGITLKPGFHARAVSKFTARIEGCTLPPAQNFLVERTEFPKLGIAKNLEVQVFPNPVREVAQVHIRLPEAGMVQVVLRDMRGIVLKQYKLEGATQGLQYLEVPVSGLPDGNYLLTVVTPAASRTLLINKLK